jgi:hypothetical protein
VSPECQCGTDVVAYIQGLWGIYIDRGKSSMEQGEVRKQIDVPLQEPYHTSTLTGEEWCKGTSVHFITSPLLSHSPPVHMYSPSSPLYYLQGPHLKPMTSMPDGPTTFQRLTHQMSSTTRIPLCLYLSSIG